MSFVNMYLLYMHEDNGSDILNVFPTNEQNVEVMGGQITYCICCLVLVGPPSSLEQQNSDVPTKRNQ